MPSSDSNRALAAVYGDLPAGSTPPMPDARRWTPVFIIASPRPLSGKTFLARLVTDFLRMDGAAVAAFDLDPGAGALADYLPGVTSKADIDSTQAQMALFDRLIVDDGVGKVVDLSTAVFARFFALIEEIGFIDEAHRRAIELVILFPADAHPTSVTAYHDLHDRFPGTVLVPVFNEAIVNGRKLRDQYPFGRAAAVPLKIPLLAPALKAYADQGPCSFADFHVQLPVAIPIGYAFELRSWTKRTFLEFRELELRILLEKLRSSLNKQA